MVRYHNSGTQKFDDTEHDSVKTGALGHNIEEAVDVSGSRSLGTWEQNTTDRTRIVSIDYRLTPTSDAVVRFFAQVGPDSQSGKSQSSHSVSSPAGITANGGPTILVPPDGYYKVGAFGDTTEGSVDNWLEADFA